MGKSSNACICLAGDERKLQPCVALFPLLRAVCGDHRRARQRDDGVGSIPGHHARDRRLPVFLSAPHDQRRRAANRREDGGCRFQWFVSDACRRHGISYGVRLSSLPPKKSQRLSAGDARIRTAGKSGNLAVDSSTRRTAEALAVRRCVAPQLCSGNLGSPADRSSCAGGGRDWWPARRAETVGRLSKITPEPIC